MDIIRSVCIFSSQEVNDNMKKIVIISSSLRNNSNSEILADWFMKGAIDAGNIVEKISLKDKVSHFCIGCMKCHQTGECQLQDDANFIVQKIQISDVVVFATPIYFNEMSGQLKTLFDRSNSLYKPANNGLKMAEKV